VLAGLKGPQGRWGVAVVGRAHDHGVDAVLLLYQKLPVILVLGRLRKFLKDFFSALPIDVTEGNNLRPSKPESCYRIRY
jgi:hypothetical protein